MSSIPVPEDILSNILMRLPFNSISLCRCVCKLWYTLLSNRSFLRTHHDLAVENNYSHIVLKANVDRKHVFYSLNISASEWSKGVEIRYPFETKGQVEILGSSNGLLCILVGKYFDESTICIWNPTTKEYKNVPKSPKDQFACDLRVHDYRVAYGFCYDNKIDDYKLIRAKVVGFLGVRRSGVQVYKLGSNSWSTHQFVPYYFPCNTSRSGIIVHGSLHWLGKPGGESYSEESPDIIVSFDVCEETFDVLAFPAAPENEDVVEAQEIGVVDGCLCILVQEPNSRLDLWVMRQYGVIESWSKHFTTNHELFVDHPIHMSNFMVYSFENGEFMLANSDSFILYNPRRPRARIVTIPGICGSGEVVSYQTSLFSLNSRTYVGEDDRTEG